MTTPPDPSRVMREPRRCIILERVGSAWCAVHDTAPDWHSDVPGWNGRAGWVCPEREVDDVMLEAGASATPDHILSVCLLVGAIAGALPVEARRLIAAYCAGDADALLALADLVEERGLTGPLAQWAEERQGWLEVTEHEHVWMPWVSGDGVCAIWASRGPSNFDGVRRCTCGVFEHEHSRPCADANCQREFGHHGLHMSRSWDAQAGLEIVDEWGNVDEHARDIMQRYLDAQPNPLMSSFYDD